MPSAFVTGGSGFIGGRLLVRLRSEGLGVRALARSDASAEAVSKAGAEAVRGDLDSVEEMRAGAQGCDYFFHAAPRPRTGARSRSSSASTSRGRTTRSPQ